MPMHVQHHETDDPTDPIDEEHAMNPATDLVEYFREYARERPEVFALVCFGVGFVLGWKLKPW